MRKKVGIVCVLILLICGIGHIVYINYIFPSPQETKKYIGEPIDVQGYRFTITDFRLLSEEESMGMVLDPSWPMYENGTRIALVDMDIEHIEDEEAGFMLTYLTITDGQGLSQGIDYDLYKKLNQNVKLGYDKLDIGQAETAHVTLPYNIVGDLVENADLEGLSDRTFKLFFHFYPKLLSCELTEKK